MKTAEYWIDKLKLAEHPEGGFYSEVYRSSESISKKALPRRYKGRRAFSTSIYFLLKGDQVSYFHRLKSDEVLHFYCGSPLIIHVIEANGRYEQIKLGSDFDEGQLFQASLLAGTWFGAEVSDQNSYSLIGCTVAPGFDFADFELGRREKLLSLFPQHKNIIEKLTIPESSL